MKILYFLYFLANKYIGQLDNTSIILVWYQFCLVIVYNYKSIEDFLEIKTFLFMFQNNTFMILKFSYKLFVFIGRVQ